MPELMKKTQITKWYNRVNVARKDNSMSTVQATSRPNGNTKADIDELISFITQSLTNKVLKNTTNTINVADFSRGGAVTKTALKELEDTTLSMLKQCNNYASVCTQSSCPNGQLCSQATCANGQLCSQATCTNGTVCSQSTCSKTISTCNCGYWCVDTNMGSNGSNNVCDNCSGRTSLCNVCTQSNVACSNGCSQSYYTCSQGCSQSYYTCTQGCTESYQDVCTVKNYYTDEQAKKRAGE